MVKKFRKSRRVERKEAIQESNGDAQTTSHPKGPAFQDPKQMKQPAVETKEDKEITAPILAAEGYEGDDEGASELSHESSLPLPTSSLVPSPPSKSTPSTLDEGHEPYSPSPEKGMGETDRSAEMRTLREKLRTLEQEVDSLRQSLGLTAEAREEQISPAEEEREEQIWEDQRNSAAIVGPISARHSPND